MSEKRAEYNAFDNMGGIPDPEEVAKQAAVDRQNWDKMEYLIHKVFAQNEDGAALILQWKEALIMTPTVTENSTQFQAGMREGEKSFIRNILLTIENIDKK